MLTVIDVHKSFGGIKALDGVSIEVDGGSITGLVGPNGSGKTTLFNVISGFYPKDAGEIYLKGERIDGLPPNEVARKGLSRTFQISQAPDKMTVLENMLLAPKGQMGEGIWNAFFGKKQVQQQERHNLDKALHLLDSVNLVNLSDEYAGNLSGGQKKLLALARILMADPEIILLDEPTAGVNPTLINSLMRTIENLRKQGKTFLFVEHNMRVISDICDRVFVLDFGKKIAEGTPQQIQQNEAVLEAYLSGSSKKWLNKIGIVS
jgi:branched-chain amino acid transport system ATP-binding protein/neutral amino acid transport system ATP-binding protein